MLPKSLFQESNSIFLVFLALTALICGALVMVIEVLGSRVISPFFGASLFIWTSLIAVTLVGLAAGYTVGGLMADRYQSPSYLYGIIFAAGIAVSLIPFLKKPVFYLSVPLGLRLGALTASALLFALPHFLLGCVSPYIIKMATHETRKVGVNVGFFFAVSTIGSFLGTIVTGFYLISYVSVDSIFLMTSVCLVVLSVVYFLVFRKKILILAFALFPLLLPGTHATTTKTMDDGTTVTKIFDKDTFYGNIKVLDRKYPYMQTREMLLDGAPQGAIDLTSRMPVFDYFYYLQYIPFSLQPQGKRCLVMGLGAGIIPLWYEKMGVTTDVIDVNPEVFSVAEQFFDFHIGGTKYVGDARYLLSISNQKYDYIILDVFNGDTLPEHMLGLESFQLISRHLTDNGIVGINLVGSLTTDTFLTASLVKTLQTVFMTVEMFPTFEPDNPYSRNSGIGNVEIFAYNFPAVSLSQKRLQSFPFHPHASIASNVMGLKFAFPPGTRGIILTDNYNPVDTLEPRIKEEVRKRVLAGNDIDILL